MDTRVEVAEVEEVGETVPVGESNVGRRLLVSLVGFRLESRAQFESELWEG